MFSIGVGLRSQHYPYLVDRPKLQVQWFEAISENYMDSQGRPLQMLEFVRKNYPLALHGVSLSIGASEDINLDYLSALKQLIDRIEPFLVSDHLCWTGSRPSNLHDLLPLPFTEEVIAHTVNKIEKVQTFLRRPILIENVSSYLTFRSSTFSEWDFLKAIVKQSGCKILLDLNNVYVNSQNHGFDANTYIRSLPAEAIGQIHLAGFTDMGNFLFDTHSKPVFPDVWRLYENNLDRLKDIPVLIEWDEDLPEFPVLEAEALKAKTLWEQKHGKLGKDSKLLH